MLQIYRRRYLKWLSTLVKDCDTILLEQAYQNTKIGLMFVYVGLSGGIEKIQVGQYNKGVNPQHLIDQIVDQRRQQIYQQIAADPNKRSKQGYHANQVEEIFSAPEPMDALASGSTDFYNIYVYDIGDSDIDTIRDMGMAIDDRDREAVKYFRDKIDHEILNNMINNIGISFTSYV